MRMRALAFFKLEDVWLEIKCLESNYRVSASSKNPEIFFNNGWKIKRFQCASGSHMGDDVQIMQLRHVLGTELNLQGKKEEEYRNQDGLKK